MSKNVFACENLPPPSTPTRRAFTRLELCAALSALVLLAIVVAPALASSKTDGERVVCFNNLRLIGRAVNSFAADHGGKVPWRTLESEGGTMPVSGTKPGNAWYEFIFMSNGIPSPRVLACPSDSGVRVASTMSQFILVSARGAAVSYTIGLDVGADNSRAWVSGDRNIRPDAAGGGCSSRVISKENANAQNQATLVAWTNAVHGNNSGHVLLNDGSVVFTDTTGLKQALTNDNDGGSSHFLKAR